jgi:hypothetical protein
MLVIEVKPEEEAKGMERPKFRGHVCRFGELLSMVRLFVNDEINLSWQTPPCLTRFPAL